MCLSISGSCLNAPRITNVRTFHCGEYPGTLAALFRINNNKKQQKRRRGEKSRRNSKPQSAAQRAGPAPFGVFCDEFLRNSSSVHADNRTDRQRICEYFIIQGGVFQGDGV